jgi:hypothetical protein
MHLSKIIAAVASFKHLRHLMNLKLNSLILNRQNFFFLEGLDIFGVILVRSCRNKLNASIIPVDTGIILRGLVYLVRHLPIGLIRCHAMFS